MRKLTEDQHHSLVKAAESGEAVCGHRVGRQLGKRGLAHYSGHDQERQEWMKVVARIPVYWLTAKGRDLAAQLVKEGK